MRYINNITQKIADGHFQSIITTMGKHDGHFGKFSSSIESMTAPAAVELPEQMQVYPLQSVVY